MADWSKTDPHNQYRKGDSKRFEVSWDSKGLTYPSQQVAAGVPKGRLSNDKKRLTRLFVKQDEAEKVIEECTAKGLNPANQIVWVGHL